MKSKTDETDKKNRSKNRWKNRLKNGWSKRWWTTGTTDMPDFESEESAAQRRNQWAKRLKILTPDQMLNRLPITLTQLKAGSSSEKL